MAISLRSLKSTKSESDVRPPISLLYGVDGIGKTSLAAEWPNAIYLSTPGERPPSDVDLPKAEIETFEDLKSIVIELLTEDHPYKTVIIDSIDGLEPMANAATCIRIGANSIDDNSKDSPAAFGKGYVAADVEWNEFMGACLALTNRGIAVVLIAHPEIKRFDSPTTDPYDRYQIKLQKRAAAIVREQSDIVAFLNYRISLKTKEVAPKKVVGHAEGGKERQIHLVEGAGFVSKNRFSMPDYIVYNKGSGFAEMAKYFPTPQGVPANDNAEDEVAAA